MKKVWICRSDDLSLLQDAINDFIEDKELIDVKINTIERGRQDRTCYTTAVIIYEDGVSNPLAHPESYLDDAMAIVDDMTRAQRVELLKYLADKVERG